ncbi:MAG: hypothetical protein HYY94_02885 [Gemmatimonadetes bacterium]|nr:hypothetical protein [Gemmatimonadota bacterium]
MELEQELASLVEKARGDVAAVKTPLDLQNLKAVLLGKKGALGAYMTRLRDLPHAQRPAFGAARPRTATIWAALRAIRSRSCAATSRAPGAGSSRSAGTRP